jgi:hypothetical protein
MSFIWFFLRWGSSHGSNDSIYKRRMATPVLAHPSSENIVNSSPTVVNNAKPEFVLPSSVESLNTSNQSVSNEDSLLSPLSQNIEASLLAIKTMEAQRR